MLSFPLEVSRGQQPRRTRKTSRSTEISDISAGSTSRWDQERSKICDHWSVAYLCKVAPMAKFKCVALHNNL